MQLLRMSGTVTLHIRMFSRFERAHGSLLPQRLTGRQAPLKGMTLVIWFISVMKTERYRIWEVKDRHGFDK